MWFAFDRPGDEQRDRESNSQQNNRGLGYPQGEREDLLQDFDKLRQRLRHDNVSCPNAIDVAPLQLRKEIGHPRPYTYCASADTVARTSEMGQKRSSQLHRSKVRFRLHEEADIEHSDMGWQTIARFAREHSMEDAVVDACRRNLNVWELHLNGIAAAGDELDAKGT